MSDAMRMLGLRIVEAARLAAQMHLESGKTDNSRQQEAVGGAGNRFSTDGELPLVSDSISLSAGRLRP